MLRNLNYEKIIEKIVFFIKRKLNQSKAKGIVIGISGGVDSAVTAFLAVKALGKERVLGLILPYYENEEIKDAILVCNILGIEYKIISIKSIIEEFEKILGLDSNKIVKGNLMVRTRMVILYSYANAKNYLVMGTSNRSEYLVGYFTKWGDGASDIAPLLNLYKTEIWEIAKKIGVPEKIIQKKPTAGLWKNQTDEDELGINYLILDQILHKMFDLKMKADEISKKLNISLEQIEYVKNLVRKTIHKRKLPPSPKIF